jgi:hypothetical protein
MKRVLHLTSVAAGANSILIALRRFWAVLHRSCYCSRRERRRSGRTLICLPQIP